MWPGYIPPQPDPPKPEEKATEMTTRAFMALELLKADIIAGRYQNAAHNAGQAIMRADELIEQLKKTT